MMPSLPSPPVTETQSSPPTVSASEEQLVGCMNLDRYFAAIFDNFLAVIAALGAAMQLGSRGDVAAWAAAALAFFGYYLVSEVVLRNTFGKWVMGLRIRTLRGDKITSGQALVRSLLRVLEVNPILFGALPAAVAMFFSKRRQRIGDRLAGTVVVPRSDLQ
jgi:uncharacterized RDD family membrane protein YckC